MARSRFTLIATAVALVIFFSYILLPGSSSAKKSTYSSPASITTKEATMVLKKVDEGGFAIAPDSVAPEMGLAGKKISEELLHGNTIMPKLGNETIKAELGRASWKLLHTTLARFPKKPTPDERQALHTYLLLFARLYPCGECATHFQKLLTEFPPQTSSRDAASQWGCHVHNLVNGRLKKPEFDCGSVTEAYKCGCAEADAEKDASKKASKTTGNAMGGDRMERSTEGITVGRPLTAAEDVDLLEENTKGSRVEVLREGLMDGG